MPIFGKSSNTKLREQLIFNPEVGAITQRPPCILKEKKVANHRMKLAATLRAHPEPCGVEVPIAEESGSCREWKTEAFFLFFGEKKSCRNNVRHHSMREFRLLFGRRQIYFTRMRQAIRSGVCY